MNGDDLLVLLKKHPIGVTCGIIALGCAATLYFRSDVVDEKKLQLEAITKQSQAMVSNIRNSAGLAQQTETLQQYAKQIDDRLVKANQLATNLQYFYRLESDTGVKVTDVRQNQTGRAASSYVGVPYSVTFQGTFKQVMEFLQRIESGKHFSKFSTVSFNKANSSDTSGTFLSVSMNIELLGTP